MFSGERCNLEAIRHNDEQTYVTCRCHYGTPNDFDM